MCAFNFTCFSGSQAHAFSWLYGAGPIYLAHFSTHPDEGTSCREVEVPRHFDGLLVTMVTALFGPRTQSGIAWIDMSKAKSRRSFNF